MYIIRITFVHNHVLKNSLPSGKILIIDKKKEILWRKKKKRKDYKCIIRPLKETLQAGWDLAPPTRAWSHPVGSYGPPLPSPLSICLEKINSFMLPEPRIIHARRISMLANKGCINNMHKWLNILAALPDIQRMYNFNNILNAWLNSESFL